MATQWLGGVKIERQGCGGETGFASCHYERNYCHLYDTYRVLKVSFTCTSIATQKKIPLFLKLHPCDQDCSVWDHWDPCVAECDETQCSPEQETKLKKMVEDSLASIRTTIGDAKKVVEGVVLRIENMLFAKQNK